MLTCSIGGLAFGDALRLGVCPCVLPGLMAWGCEVMLTLTTPGNESFNTTDVVQIPNTDLWPTAPKLGYYADETQPDGLKRYPASGLYRGGFVATPIAFDDFEVGDIVPFGLLETRYIIQHRNRILDDEGIKLNHPSAIGDQSELDNLNELISAANVTPGNAYRYYFPAASTAYAYEPHVKEGETLNKDLFGAHRWFLPTTGDLYRIISFVNRGESTAFENAKNAGVLNLTGYAHTTGERIYNGVAKTYQTNLNTGVCQTIDNENWSKGKVNAYVLPLVWF